MRRMITKLRKGRIINVILAAAILSLALAACGGKEETQPAAEDEKTAAVTEEAAADGQNADTASAPLTASEGETAADAASQGETEAAASEALTGEPSEYAEEDGQNPIMNFIGPYACGRASMLVEPEGMDGAKISVTWGSSAAESGTWSMSGKFDMDTLTVEYADCVKKDLVYREGGEIESETVLYENGTGRITFREGDPLALIWEDDQEHIADDSVFEWSFVPVDEADSADAVEIPEELAALEVDYGTSVLFTAEELETAADRIKGEFASWSGCEMHSLRYAGDESNTQENLDWLNSLNEGANFVKAAEFLSDFHSPVEQYGAWEPDMEYTDYQWWLGMTEDGSWELVTWGY